MASIADLTKNIEQMIAVHPMLRSELQSLITQVSELDVPEIAIQIDEGRIQNVERFNDAPFTIHVHDHQIDGTADQLSEMTWNTGKIEPALMSTYNLLNVFQKWDGPFWFSLRNQPEFHGHYDDEALAA